MCTATTKYFSSACSEPGPGLGRGWQWFLVVLRGMCAGPNVCLSDSNPGLELPWALFLASLCLGFSTCKMGS